LTAVEDDDLRNTDHYHCSSAASRLSRQRSRRLCGDAGKPGSDALPRHRPDIDAGRRLAHDGDISRRLGVARLRHVGLRKDDDGAFIGSVGIFHPLDWPEPEIAYSLDRPYWGRGLATEAAAAARDWLFGNFSFERAASFIRPENSASKRVAQRLGAVCERTFELRGSPYEYWVHHRSGKPH
jgi:Acetyltransferase (GNAT) domain